MQGRAVFWNKKLKMKIFLLIFAVLAIFSGVSKAKECKDLQMKVNCDGWKKRGYCLRSSKYCKYTSRVCRKTCLQCFKVESLQPGCGKQEPQQAKRIIGGAIAKPGDWPWIVTIDSTHNKDVKGHYCGGTLITDEWIITAAHCFQKGKNLKDYWLKLGEHHLNEVSGHEQHIPIAEIIVHPDFDSDTFDYDIALIRLARKATLNDKVKTACLPNEDVNFKKGTKCFVAGWGYLSLYRRGPKVLHQATVPLVDHFWCQFSYHDSIVTPSMLCAGYEDGGVDACKGDSGAPLMCKSANDTWFLWGVVSWGEGCGMPIKYGVYANVKFLRTWINEVIFLQPQKDYSK